MLLIVQFLTILGSELTSFALPIWVYLKNQDNTSLSLLFFAALLPKALLGSISGVISDRYNPKIICSATQVLQALFTMALLFFVNQNNSNISILFLCSLGIGIGNAIYFPSFQKLIPHLNYNLKKTLSYVGGLENFALFIAPIAAAPILSLGKFEWILEIDIITYFIGFICILIFAPKIDFKISNRKSWIEEAKIGYRFIYSNQILLSLLIIGAFSNLAFTFSLEYLTPYLIKLQIPLTTIGTFTSGALLFQSLGSFLTGKINYPKNLLLFEIIWTAIIGILLITIGLISASWILFILYSLILIILPFLNIWNRQLWYDLVPHEIQGRAFALRRSISSSLAFLGTMCSGPLLDKLSTKISQVKVYQTGFIIAGLFLFCSTLISFKISKKKK